MIEIAIIGVGKIKEKYLQEMIADYQKRISKYAAIDIIELKDESNKIDENVVKELEGQRIISAIKDGFYAVLLDLKGESLDSVNLSKKIDEISTYHSSKIAFIIGGSYGVSEAVKKRANYKLCFSKMTFPHQLIRGMLLEQIYRSFKILNNETYHK